MANYKTKLNNVFRNGSYMLPEQYCRFMKFSLYFDPLYQKWKTTVYAVNQKDIYKTLLLFWGVWAPLAEIGLSPFFLLLLPQSLWLHWVLVDINITCISHSQHGVMLQCRRDGVKPDMPTTEEWHRSSQPLEGSPTNCTVAVRT